MNRDLDPRFEEHMRRVRQARQAERDRVRAEAERAREVLQRDYRAGIRLTIAFAILLGVVAPLLIWSLS